ncbi:MAG: hypothetical protein LLF94_06610 [Chlamydiales bacterium]|nr:hypothetical protein [Chlamydiales bacterium]
MQLSGGFFTPGSQDLQAQFQLLQASIQNATGQDVIHSVEIFAKFATLTRTGQLLETLQFIYGFPMREDEACRVSINYTEDSDDSWYANEANRCLGYFKKDNLPDLSLDFKTMTGSVAKMVRAYKFFMDMSNQLRRVKDLREITIAVVDSRCHSHKVAFTGNFKL